MVCNYQSSAARTLPAALVAAIACSSPPPPPVLGSDGDVARVRALYEEFRQRHCAAWARCPSDLAPADWDEATCASDERWVEEHQIFAEYSYLVGRGLVTFDEDGIAACWSGLDSCTDATQTGCVISGIFKGTRPEGAPCWTGAECAPDMYCAGSGSTGAKCGTSNPTGTCQPVEDSEATCLGLSTPTCGASYLNDLSYYRYCINDRCERADRMAAGPEPMFVGEGEVCDTRNVEYAAIGENGWRARICRRGLICGLGTSNTLDTATCWRPQDGEGHLGDPCRYPDDCSQVENLFCTAGGVRDSGQCVAGNLPTDARCTGAGDHDNCGQDLTCLPQGGAPWLCRPSNLGLGQTCANGGGVCGVGLFCAETSGICEATAEGSPCRDTCPWPYRCNPFVDRDAIHAADKEHVSYGLCQLPITCE